MALHTRILRAMQISPLVPSIPGFGISVRGLDLSSSPTPAKEIEKIIALVNKYRYYLNEIVARLDMSSTEGSSCLALLQDCGIQGPRHSSRRPSG